MQLDLTEAIEAAAQAMRDNNSAQAWEDTTPGHVPIAIYAQAAIRAAAPALERQVREKIAQEIEALDHPGYYAVLFRNAFTEAAAIARGSSPSSSTEEKGQR